MVNLTNNSSLTNKNEIRINRNDMIWQLMVQIHKINSILSSSMMKKSCS